MSDLTATVEVTKNGFHVDGYEKISYDFTFLDGVFNKENPQLAECYKRWGRVLAVTDLNVYNVYGEQIEEYFEHYGLKLKVHKTKIGEKAKTIPTFLSIVDSMTEFGIYRKVLDCNKSHLWKFNDLSFLGTSSRCWWRPCDRCCWVKLRHCQRLYQGTLPSISLWTVCVSVVSLLTNIMVMP